MVQFPSYGPVQVAEIGQRAIARCIDVAICIGAVFIFATLGVFSLLSGSDSPGFIFIFLMIFAYVVLAIFYEWIFIGLWGATLGKMAMHVKVVDQSTGFPIGLGPAFVRHLVMAGPILLPYIGVLLGIAVLISPVFDNSGRLQGWHDKAANDLVIKQ